MNKKARQDTLKQRIQPGDVNFKSAGAKKEYPLFPCGKTGSFFKLLSS
jgi:hypothetical protein